jgi:hypothetical protein
VAVILKQRRALAHEVEHQDVISAVVVVIACRNAHPRLRNAVLAISNCRLKRVPLLETDSNAIYASGYLLYLRESNLMAQPFDPKRLATSGDAVPIPGSSR